jgi:hypothetical protein
MPSFPTAGGVLQSAGWSGRNNRVGPKSNDNFNANAQLGVQPVVGPVCGSNVCRLNLYGECVPDMLLQTLNRNTAEQPFFSTRVDQEAIPYQVQTPIPQWLTETVIFDERPFAGTQHGSAYVLDDF